MYGDLEDYTPRRKFSFSMVITALTAFILIALVVIAIVGSIAIGIFSVYTDKQLRSYVDSKRVMQYLKDLEGIANLEKNKFSRAIQMGFNDSAEYVIKKLEDEKVPCKITRQYFNVPLYEDLEPQTQSIIEPMKIDLSLDEMSAEYGERGLVDNVEVYIAPLRACNDTDWEGAEGKIVLASRIHCPFPKMVDVAKNAKAKALLMHSFQIEKLSEQVEQFSTIEEEESIKSRVPYAPFPFRVVRSALIVKLIHQWHDEGNTVRMRLDSSKAVLKNYPTYNVICESMNENVEEDSVIIIGAHLDSVTEGPGINDNGSGSMTILELAIQFLKFFSPKYKVIFAWWSAEELGLLGSKFYVQSLSAEEKKKIVTYLNLDMVGSPNYNLEIGDPTAMPDLPCGKPCINLMNLMQEVFNSTNKNYTLDKWQGNSDYYPFAAEGIPAAGIFTGIQPKSLEQKQKFGGGIILSFFGILINQLVLAAPADPCYHQRCDTVDNISEEAIKNMLEAAAEFLQRLSETSKLRDFVYRE